MNFIKELSVCDKSIMQPDDIITYRPLVQESMCEYHNIVELKRWDPNDNNKISKYETSLMMDSTVLIQAPVNKTVEKFYCEIRHKVKDNKSGVGSSTKSVITYHKCGKKGHLKRNCKFNKNGSDGELSKISTVKLTKWVTKKPLISDVENTTRATMNQKKAVQMVYFLK